MTQQPQARAMEDHVCSKKLRMHPVITCCHCSHTRQLLKQDTCGSIRPRSPPKLCTKQRIHKCSTTKTLHNFLFYNQKQYCKCFKNQVTRLVSIAWTTTTCDPSKKFRRFHQSIDTKHKGLFCWHSEGASALNSCIQDLPQGSKELRKNHLQAVCQPSCLHWNLENIFAPNDFFQATSLPGVLRKTNSRH